MRTATRPTTGPGTGTVGTAREGRTGYDHLIPHLEQLAGADEGSTTRSDLRDHVIRELRPLVRNLSRRFAPGGRGIEDVEQAGMLGLVKAVDRYDPASATGGPLGFFVPSIRGEMKRYLRDHSWSVRVPRDLKELAVTVQRTADTLGQELGRAPRPSELARELNVGVDQIVDALGALDSHRARSLDAPTGDGAESGDGIPLGEQMGGEDPDLHLAAHRGEMNALIRGLPERERTILMMRFYGDRTQSSIAAEMGISQMHVSRLLSRTLTRLREGLAEQD